VASYKKQPSLSDFQPECPSVKSDMLAFLLFANPKGEAANRRRFVPLSSQFHNAVLHDSKPEAPRHITLNYLYTITLSDLPWPEA